MIYFMPICEADQLEAQYQNWLPHLPPSRQEKLLRYRFSKDRWLCAAAYMLLLHGLQEEYGLAEDQIVMKIADSGKPYLSSHPHIYFNLSHCDAGVACGISNVPIGVDIEVVRYPDSRVVMRTLSVYEHNLLKTINNQADIFTAIWTLKESWIKATGYGLEYSLPELTIDIGPHDQYQLCKDSYTAAVIIHSSDFYLSVCQQNSALPPPALVVIC